jgi:hypothetical protein
MEKGQTIYVRTPQGDAELKLRHSALGPVVNGLLMLVNGQRTLSELVSVASKLGAPTQTIEQLRADGYIQLAPPRVASGHTRPAPLTDAAPLLESTPVMDGWSDNDRRAFLYQTLIETAKKHLGLGGFVYHLKIERAVTLQELRDLAKPIGEAVARSKGPSVARALMKQLEGV